MRIFLILIIGLLLQLLVILGKLFFPVPLLPISLKPDYYSCTTTDDGILTLLLLIVSIDKIYT
jgi:hypothetical protein